MAAVSSETLVQLLERLFTDATVSLRTDQGDLPANVSVSKAQVHLDMGSDWPDEKVEVYGGDIVNPDGIPVYVLDFSLSPLYLSRGDRLSVGLDRMSLD